MNFQTRTINLISEQQRELAVAMVINLPIWAGIEVVARQVTKVRTLDQNARMWAGPLKDIEDQAWLRGRKYSAYVWHEYFKTQYLPEDGDHDIDALVKDPSTYRKWETGPGDLIICIGSTGQLTRKGFSEYMERVHAFGAYLGVMFSAGPND
jgi:hypothetical protein